jgi:hypothetical protein
MWEGCRVVNVTAQLLESAEALFALRPQAAQHGQVLVEEIDRSGARKGGVAQRFVKSMKRRPIGNRADRVVGKRRVLTLFEPHW